MNHLLYQSFDIRRLTIRSVISARTRSRVKRGRHETGIKRRISWLVQFWSVFVYNLRFVSRTLIVSGITNPTAEVALIRLGWSRLRISSKLSWRWRWSREVAKRAYQLCSMILSKSSWRYEWLKNDHHDNDRYQKFERIWEFKKFLLKSRRSNIIVTREKISEESTSIPDRSIIKISWRRSI